jgi:hypothetical protein
MKKIILVYIFSVSLLFGLNNDNNNHNITQWSNGDQGINRYFNKLNIPNIYITNKCNKKGDVCWPIIKNQDNKILKQFGSKDSISHISGGRYENIAYLYFSRTYKSGKEVYTNYYMLDNNGKKYKIPYCSNSKNILDSIITKDAKCITVNKDGLNILPYKSQNILYAKISNNPNGDISIIAINDKNKIILSNGSSFYEIDNNQLSSRGDRKNIISSYPINSNQHIFSTYKYVNSYNKGMVYGSIDFLESSSENGWLINSENENIGWDPSIIYNQKENKIYVTAKNSSKNILIHTSFEDNLKFKSKLQEKPKHIEGFEEEDYFHLIAGSSVSKISWIATNKIKQKNENGDTVKDFGKVDYEINDSIYISKYIEGKIGDNQIAIEHLTNNVKEEGGITQKASEYLTAVVDFNDLFAPQESLRIKIEQAHIYGSAVYIDSSSNSSNNIPVDTEFVKINALNMMERGKYWGIEYANYVMPTLIGYSKFGDIKFAVFDKDLELKKYTLVYGKDTLSYAKRYENNFSTSFIDYRAGLGLAKVNLSDEALLTANDLKGSYDDIEDNLTLAYELELNFGYHYQQKLKSLKGLGISTQAGYKFLYTGYISGSNKDDDSNNNNLTLEFDRKDLWHGPYLSVNITKI